MAPKRGRTLYDAFDPNKSDSEDENFEPDAEDPRPRRPKKKVRTGAKKMSGRRGNHRYRGSDIDDDDDDVIDESEGSFGSEEEEEEESDEEVHTTATGRRARKAAVNHASYRESSGEGSDASEVNENDEETKPPPPRKSRIITLKTTPAAGAKNSRARRVEATAFAAGTRRTTRARTAELSDDEFVELSNSGRHAIRASSKSKSPETLTRRRPTRAVKGVKAPPTIEEATQETGSAQDQNNEEEKDAEQVTIEIDIPDAPGETNVEAGVADEPVNALGDDAAEKRESIEEDEDDDEDDIPVRRGGRTRASRVEESPKADKTREEAPAEPEQPSAGHSGRLTRSQQQKSAQEPSSDFDPGNGSEEDADGSGSEASQKAVTEEDDDECSTPRRSTRSKSKSKRKRGDESDSAEELDKEEMLDELLELQEPRRTRRRQTLAAEEPSRKTRRSAARPVSYYQPVIPTLNVDDEEEVPAEAAPRARSARGRNGGGGWERALNTTYGPFGGGGGGSLLGGPWGTGATGGVETDSSDDESPDRPGVPGNIGMTPTTANAPPHFPGLGGGAGGFGTTPNVGKIKNQKAFADADPLGVDMSVDFGKVGGLADTVNQLKEMILLPLLYPELFLKFHVTPPRGALFHGPPGTGKTLVARALSNSVSHNGKKVTFYMRKGADALSKWVGEAEKQLRLLFEEARRTQPSIIFFDEIDGLAPVRSSKQEQIHASIVSTLLALMDGMDGRGQVIVIGATNRPDNIDPALRRPGRFDREFYFPLPDKQARRDILEIHTKDFGLSPEFKDSLAARTKGYAGADLRSLCTESALNAIQRAYPQIYSSQEKLVVDPNKIAITATDFALSMKKLIPSSERSASSSAASLPKSIEPLLKAQLDSAKDIIDTMFPRKKKTTALEEAMYEQYDDGDHGFAREAMQQEFERSRIFRPRLLLGGLPGMGQGYLSSAIMHYLEGVNVQNFGLSTLLGDGLPAETVMVRLFTEVKRNKPSVIFIPDVDAWYTTLVANGSFVTFRTLLRSLPATDPILVLGTAECELEELSKELLRDLFGFSKKNRFEISRPTTEQRREYFSGLLTYLRKRPDEFPDPVNRKKRVLEVLEVARAPTPKPPSKEELKAQLKMDRQMLNYLKIQLQPIMDQINRKYRKFRNPVIPVERLTYLFDEQDPNFVRTDVVEAQNRPFEIVKDKDGADVLRETATGKIFYNLETTTIEERLSNGFYARPKDFLKDIRCLAKDSKNIGDRDRTLKANELEANVEVDIMTIESSSKGLDWEALYARQVQRTKEIQEKERKKRALETIISQVRSDMPENSGNDSEAGPVTLGAPVPGTRTTAARFLPVGSPEAANTSGSNNLTNGTSVPSKGVAEEPAADEDTQMFDSPMAPPSQWPRVGPRPLGQSIIATAGNTQMSQVSVLTTLPPGVSPSAVNNEASTTTTKPSDQSHQTSENWTQGTNGYHHNHQLSQQNSQIPDTQPLTGVSLSQDTSSEDAWLHSQAHAQAHGALVSRSNLFGASPTSSQQPYGHRNATAVRRTTSTHATPSMANLLNDPLPDDSGISSSNGPSSGYSSVLRNSGVGSSQSQQLTVISERELQSTLRNLTQNTDGFTVEQLEQIYRELMDEIWRQRGNWNRMEAMNSVVDAFNAVVMDMDEAGLLPGSQE